MVFPDDFDDPEEEREEALENREEWLEEVEDEYIAQGDISASETVDGHEPDLDDEDAFENEFDEAMHEEDID
jgi:hypothetical protein